MNTVQTRMAVAEEFIERVSAAAEYAPGAGADGSFLQ